MWKGPCFFFFFCACVSKDILRKVVLEGGVGASATGSSAYCPHYGRVLMRPARGSASLCTSVDGVSFALFHPSSLTNCLAVDSFFLGSLLLRQSAPNQQHQTSVVFLCDKSAGSQGHGIASEPLRIEFSFLLIIRHFLVLLIGDGPSRAQSLRPTV